MSYPGGRGKADYFDEGTWNAQCYECGRKFKANTLLRHWQGYYVCPEHWEARQPQDFVRNVPDNQTPPWVQVMPTPVYEFGDLLLTESSTTDLWNANYIYILTETSYPLTTE